MLPDGLGATTGPVLALCRPLLMSGDVWYVSSVNGVDAVSPAGLDRAAPLATLAQAVSNAADGDIIVLLGDHDETLTSTVTISAKRLRIQGEGRSAGIPTPKLTVETGSNPGLTLNTAGVVVSGVKFGAPTEAVTGATLNVAASGVRVEDCYFELNENSGAAQISQGDTRSRLVISDTSFVNISTTDAPNCALETLGDENRMNNVTIDGGTTGFAGAGYGYDGSGAAQTSLEFVGVSLLNGADMRLNASSTGWLNVGTATGGAKVVW